ncbi:hypothetical protein [Arhodomonas sp. SL1]|uniref:hypothetical protein n=1 Tax=Arhodomonas sp. SL1 TaxID=3425691 RepID=UPI003F882A6A
MLKNMHNAELIREWHDAITDADARDAFLYIVGCAAALRGYECHPQWKGEVRGFRFYRANSSDWPYSFIVNQRWLLFYIRRPGVSAAGFSARTLQDAFETATENSAGEWTVKLRSIDDVKILWHVLGLGRG